MPDETMKCPSCGVALKDSPIPMFERHPLSSSIDGCVFDGLHMRRERWQEIHRLHNTLPDGTELGPGDYRLKKVLRSGEVVAAEFTIPEPEPTVDDATLAIIRAAYPSAVCVGWSRSRCWVAYDMTMDGAESGGCLRKAWRIDPALLPPWEGEGEPPVIELKREGE